MWIGDHRFLTYIFQWEQLKRTGPSHPASTSHWMAPLRQTDHRLFHKKHIGAKIRKILFTPTPHWENICVNLDSGFRSLMLCTCISYEFQIKCNSVSHHFDCVWCNSNSGTVPWWSGTVTWWIKKNHIIGVKWTALCLHVTNDTRSLKWHNEVKKIHCYN